MAQTGDYCSFEKAVEHLGDRWSLLIVRELALHGSRGFNALVESLPGISRPVLVRRLRKLEDFGVVAREPSPPGHRSGPYRLAPAGERLAPTLRSLHSWAEDWATSDPVAAARRDPDVIGFWLKLRVDRRNLPDVPVVVVVSIGEPARSGWLVLERASAPSLCAEDPCLAPDRYVHVEADAMALYPISRGLRDWQAAIADRSVRLFGDPDLVGALPSWFLPSDTDATTGAFGQAQARRSSTQEVTHQRGHTIRVAEPRRMTG